MWCECTRSVECGPCSVQSSRRKPVWFLLEQELTALRNLERAVRAGAQVRDALLALDAAREPYVKDGERVPLRRNAND